MQKLELIERISNGEDSYTQFKEQIISSKDLAKEFVAFANADGGVLIFGVDDDENIVGLEKKDVEKIGQLVGNVGQENVKPPIHPLTQNMSIDEKRVTIVTIESGFAKPYKTSSGIYYTKSGADKKIMSDEELKRLFSEPKGLYADEEILPKTTISNLNQQLYYLYLEKHNRDVFEALEKGLLSLEKLLENEMIMREGSLTLSGNLIFGINPQRFSPSFYVDCCYFDGNEIFVDKFISKKRVLGTFEKLYDESMGFVKSHLRHKQVEKDFNSNGMLEIDERVLGELITNALIHRDYYINSSIKVFIFHNRVEIISPGKLTNSLTLDNIKNGRSICRNPTLDSICEDILAYTGYGSGIQRVIEINPNVEFINDRDLEQFKCIIPRSIADEI
ncbi:MAG: putative DNA binding domain-containing protein [Campylobacterota bacterium]|nr:putative DNA binding domain-containing protein [Campylobacterota bacterium]